MSEELTPLKRAYLEWKGYEGSEADFIEVRPYTPEYRAFVAGWKSRNGEDPHNEENTPAGKALVVVGAYWSDPAEVRIYEDDELADAGEAYEQAVQQDKIGRGVYLARVVKTNEETL